MDWLIDTSIITRTIHVGSALQPLAIDALARLRIKDETLCIVPQNLIEFWAVATRPATANGLRLSIEEAENELAEIKRHFVLKAEDQTIFQNWEQVVKAYRVSGKTTHDARIIAQMQTHNITNLLTFNIADFQRYAQMVSVFAPSDIK